MSLQLQIEKLKGLDNYKAWSMTVRAYLESEELWTIVENGPENNEEKQSFANLWSAYGQRETCGIICEPNILCVNVKAARARGVVM